MRLSSRLASPHEANRTRLPRSLGSKSISVQAFHPFRAFYAFRALRPFHALGPVSPVSPVSFVNVARPVFFST